LARSLERIQRPSVMSFDPKKPHNELPLLPPQTELETKTVLKKCISANRALAELKGLGETIPNQGMLVNSLVLQEAKSSSEIENVVTTDDVLFQAFTASTSQTDPATKEVLRYREAIWEGYKTLQSRPLLTTNLCIKIVQTIKKNQAGIRNTPGTTISNRDTGEVIYTPPVGEDLIRDKLRNLEEYIHGKGEEDPLVKMAVMHYQFEAVHPFTDGNGRTGRILNTLFMILNDLLELPVLYLSKCIIETKSDYYRLLREVTERGAWEAWILYMLEAVEQTANHTGEKILAIRNLLNETLVYARENLPKRVYSKDLIELLFGQPYTKVKFLVDAGIAKRQAAADYLKELEAIGILRAHKIGKENLYLNVKLYDLLSK
jgi:Fic family protein